MLDIATLSHRSCARYVPVAGLRVQAVGSQWAVYSPRSGQTHVLNDESVAILECAQARAQGVRTADVAAELGAVTALEPRQMIDIIELTWVRLVDAGLVLRDTSGAPSP